MPAHIIVGAQWGDEGKGRIADWLAASADIVARYGGGDNAGHTVRVGEDTFKLHLVPSGVLYPSARCVMGPGMVVNPIKLADELRGLAGRGIDVSPRRIVLSDRAHLITAAHRALDAAREARRGEGAIGTTLRGIGPAYTDRAAREGLRAGDMRHPEAFAARARERIAAANQILEGIYGAEPVNVEAAVTELVGAATLLAPYLDDASRLLYEALVEGRTVLCEGAQGTLLDIDHGGYPYVTSSSTIAGGALTGLGIGPRWVDRVIGVAKAYSTRVGAGPMPTELQDALGDRLRGTGANPWDEFGTTTGRPRRCGWLDGVVLRYAGRVNGLTELMVTKLDILSGFDTLQIAGAYRLNGRTLRDLPSDLETLAQCQAVYDQLPGWAEPVDGVRRFADLPLAAQGYITRIEALMDVPVSLITVGPARDQTVIR